MEILVFKTNVCAHDDVNLVRPLLGTIRNIRQWNFDLEDCDRILRIVAEDISPRHIEVTLQKAGFSCTELE